MSNYTFTPEVVEQAFQKFQATLSPEMKERLNGRLERGLAIAHNGGVSSHSEPNQATSTSLYKVQSSNPYNPPYLVDLQARSCTCPDHWKGHYCKHRIAANIIKTAILASKPTPPTPAKVAPKEAIPVPKTETKPAKESPVQPKGTNSQKDSIIWGILRMNGELLGVEVLSIDGEQAKVRALPKIIDGKKLQPQFPFDGKLSTTTIPKNELFHVKVFQ